MKSLSSSLLMAMSLCLLAQSPCATQPAGASFDVDAKSSESLVWPAPPDKPRIRFVRSFSTPQEVGIRPSTIGRIFELLAGQDQEVLRLPQQISISSDSRLFVTDQNKKCIHIFDLDNKRYTRLKSFGEEPLYSPAGVAIDNEGRLYVSDSVGRKILVYDSRYKPLFSIGGPDILLRPTGMVYLRKVERLYVVDTLAHNLKVFDKAGNLKSEIGRRGDGEGSFNYPVYISGNGSGRIYVTDTLNYRIQVFDAEGTFLTAFGKAGDMYGSFSKAKGVAVDSRGNIYVVDALHDVIQIFNTEGQLLLSFCGPGSAPGQLWLASGVAIDADDRIYVADTYNQRIQVFELISTETSE